MSAVITLFIYGLLHRDRYLSTRRSQAFCPSGTSRSSSLRTSFYSLMIIALNNKSRTRGRKKIARKRVRASERYYEVKKRKRSALFQGDRSDRHVSRIHWLHYHHYHHHSSPLSLVIATRVSISRQCGYITIKLS